MDELPRIGTDPVPKVHHTPTQAQCEQYDHHIKSDMAALKKLLLPILNKLAGCGDNVTKEAVIYFFQLALDHYCKIRDLDRGVLIAPDIEQSLISFGKVTALSESRNTGSSIDPAPPPEPDTAVEAVSLQVPDSADTDPAVSGDDSGEARHRRLTLMRMYSSDVMKRLKLKQGHGTRAKDPLIIGVDGTETTQRPDMALCGTVTKTQMWRRKQQFIRSFRGRIFKNKDHGVDRFVTLHPWVIFAWAELLFSAVSSKGWCNLQKLIGDFDADAAQNAPRPPPDPHHEYLAAETPPELRVFYETIDTVRRHDVDGDSYRSFRKAQAEAKLHSSWRDVMAAMQSPASKVSETVSTWEESSSPANTNAAQRVKSFLMSELSMSARDLEDRLTMASASSTISREVGVGFFALLEYGRLKKAVNMAGNFTETMFNHFIKQNPEVRTLSYSLETQLTQYLNGNRQLRQQWHGRRQAQLTGSLAGHVHLLLQD